ncbi:MAG: sulfurtransferase-like selenium metabolism protein YedF [Proteobacteria bacterium]|nr:sulfurtransferase-like selenium metabolism protein YedF [Desulfobulbaceae bacterium]MBU4151540.1 sulfurtransferase-like selenium metabolism protein YedF [Pseudomonadota bacterium]MDP2104760.1 sulfurtransferase-like selenium metabolism protein YedF [Desulfobulbaceae bacterium]
MTQEIDCRGLACPAPVLQVREILEKGSPASLIIVVDNEAAWENVTRFLEYHNFQITTERQGSDFRVTGTRNGEESIPVQESKPVAEGQHKKILIMVGTNRMGHGDDGLGSKLLINFLKTLKEMGPDLWLLVFINSGVTLAAEDSEGLPILQGLACEGVKILVCGTCLTHFNLLDKKQVGETTNMLDIVTAMQLADSVITV